MAISEGELAPGPTMSLSGLEEGEEVGDDEDGRAEEKGQSRDNDKEATDSPPSPLERKWTK